MHITSTRGTWKVAQDGKEYEAIQGFVFDLPDPLALHLLDIKDDLGPLWRLPEQDDYDLPEDIAPPAAAKKTAAAPKASKKPSTDGTPPVTGQ